ncbi:MAG TPA: hypothetical protein PKC77_12335 [Sphingopyxis sp.]|nr:hypothetical protein [Sphingopyxis sp.]
MSISALFNRLDAPLTNVQWSWGAQRSDGSIFLRVWQDETFREGSRTFVRLAKHELFQDDPSNLGYAERLRHLEMLRQGASGYAIMLRAVDPKAYPRSIAGFNKNEVFQLGEICLIDGNEWAELIGRIAIRDMTS